MPPPFLSLSTSIASPLLHFAPNSLKRGSHGDSDMESQQIGRGSNPCTAAVVAIAAAAAVGVGGWQHVRAESERRNQDIHITGHTQGLLW